MSESPFWTQTRAIGVGIGRAAARAGRGIQSAYLAIDPDLRKHVAQLPLVGLTMLAPGAKMLGPLPDDGHRPLVFVHGLGGGPGNFAPLRTFLRFHGRRRTYTLALPLGQTIEELAARLSTFIGDLCVVNELAAGAQIDLVAHSMGGLVARVALEDPVVRTRIATLVTLGTPHSGTWLARYAATANTLHLRPDSEILTRLRAQLPWNGTPRLTALWSSADMMLLPPGSACVDGADNVEMPGFTHYSYLIHPAGWKQVLTALEQSAA